MFRFLTEVTCRSKEFAILSNAAIILVLVGAINKAQGDEEYEVSYLPRRTIHSQYWH